MGLRCDMCIWKDETSHRPCEGATWFECRDREMTYLKDGKDREAIGVWERR